ncbi:MAG TPA: TlpA disulfide reductase family protein [Acidimicrobiales bacterium]|nr:TlpA disulfide reductase family protein [Acidimicrobiales bacterium]
MTRSSPPATRRRAAKPNRTPIVVLAAVVAAVLIALGVALAVGGGSDDTADNAGNGDPATTGTVTVSGEALPEFADSANDPAVGMTLPTLDGHDQSGAPMTISGDGRPTMIMFVAHWCPHCQREVPVVQRWVDDGRLPEGVDLVSVSTAIDPSRPNYPPDAWLADEGWTAPVLVDAANSAAAAVGLSAYPFFVAIDGDGRVVLRASGELTTDQLDNIASSLAQGAPAQ